MSTDGLTEAQRRVLYAARDGNELDGRSWPAVKRMFERGLVTFRVRLVPGPSPGIGGREAITVRLTEAGRELLRTEAGRRAIAGGER